jgi:predicted nuclease of predicted toxin-antitoxin system
VRLLVDANLSPRVTERLNAAGHDARHVVDVGLVSASDALILDAADAEGRVVVSSDTDFGALLARRDRASPSFVLIRHMNELTPDGQADLLLAAIAQAEPELEAGAVVTIARGKVRARRLLKGPELRTEPPNREQKTRSERVRHDSPLTGRLTVTKASASRGGSPEVGGCRAVVDSEFVRPQKGEFAWPVRSKLSPVNSPNTLMHSTPTLS